MHKKGTNKQRTNKEQHTGIALTRSGRFDEKKLKENCFENKVSDYWKINPMCQQNYFFKNARNYKPLKAKTKNLKAFIIFGGL